MRRRVVVVTVLLLAVTLPGSLTVAWLRGAFDDRRAQLLRRHTPSPKTASSRSPRRLARSLEYRLAEDDAERTGDDG